MRLRIPLVLTFSALIVAAVAACSGGGGSGSYPSSLQPSPNVAVASPLPSPVSNQSVAVAQVNAAPISNAPVPAPSGYTSSLSIPIATVPANTHVTVNSSTTIPATSTIPPLSSSRKSSASSRMPQASSGSSYSVIFFDSIQPSNPITVAGALSATQAFPAGTLFKNTTYYLGFYDPTQPSPAWQTIASTMTSDGVTLTFSGTAGATTLAANATYGFAIFSVAVGSTATPPPAAQLLAYIPQNTAGIVEVNAAGVTATTLPIAANSLGLDDGGNVYALQPQAYPTAAAGAATPSPIPAMLAKYAAGSSTVATVYTPSNLFNDAFVQTSGAGEVAVFGGATSSSSSPTGLVLSYDVWDYTSTGGAPSRTIVEPSAGTPFGILDHAGNLYTTHINANGTFNYDVYAPGSSTPTTIPETIVPAAQQAYFNPNYAAVGLDGTLYVTEFGFYANDPLAGLYIYKPNGSGGYTETKVATTSTEPNGTVAPNGPGPEGVDVDASGNIYVANANFASQYDANGNYTGQSDDQLHDITVYAPGGTSVLRHITGTFSPVPIAVAADGTLFFASYNNYSDGTGVNASFSVLAGTSTVTQVAPTAATLFALYDGTRETTGIHRAPASSTASSAAGHFGVGPRGQAKIHALRRAHGFH